MTSKMHLIAKTFLEPPYIFAKNIYNLAGGNKNPSRSGFISATVTTAALLALYNFIDIGIGAIDSFISNDYSKLAKKLADRFDPLNASIIAATPLGMGYCAKKVIDEGIKEEVS